jgi:alkylated DNA nucleotide flippase Atl1
VLPSPFAERVLDLVDQIPSGKVLAYSDVAEVLGEGGARAVGTVMGRFGSGVPWHRVVRADGRVAAGHEAQALALLRAEGTPMRGDRVDLAQARWKGPMSAPMDIGPGPMSEQADIIST